MSSGARLKSQEVAWLEYTNQALALKKQRKDQVMRQQKNLRSENVIDHFLAESKHSKKMDLTDLLIEKNLLESKMALPRDRITDA